MTQTSKDDEEHIGIRRARLLEVLETAHVNDGVSKGCDAFIIALIMLNVVAFALGTVDEIAAVYGPALELFNFVSVIIFTIEYLLRLWVCVDLPPLRHLPPWKARLKFACRPLLLIDLIAIAPFYLSFLFALDLRVLRVLRLLRFFKLARYSTALQTLGSVMVNERSALFAAAIIMFAMLLFSSTIIYFLERTIQPEVFGSVPRAAWWALSTLTTVGYGDVVPLTVAGKFFGAIVMVFGLGMFALPIGILATGFSQEIHRREFVVTWSMVAQVPLFAALDAASIAKVMANLRALTFPAGAVVIRDDEQLNAMYFIASGEVLVVYPDGTQLLETGDHFGQANIVPGEHGSLISARAISNCNLMVLDRHDFAHLLHENPEFAAQISEGEAKYKSRRKKRSSQSRKTVAKTAKRRGR